LIALAVILKSSAPAILKSIWSSVSAVIEVSASASKINSCPFKSTFVPATTALLPNSNTSVLDEIVPAFICA